MDQLILTTASAFLISLIAFVGMIVLFIKEEMLSRVLLVLVAFSAGVLMGCAFLHLLPEAIAEWGIGMTLWVLFGFILFFFIENVLQWHHCHKVKHVRTFGYMNLIGDAVHNFTDGLIIAASFTSSLHIGVVTTIAIAAHEIPQEIGDFGVLLYSGFKKIKALALNFFVALTVVGGGVVGYLLIWIEAFIPFLLPLAAGGFIYIAASDLIPEIKRAVKGRKQLLTFVVFLLGILLMHFIGMLFE